LAAQRRELERGVEEGVRKAVARLTVPRREQLDEFKARLDQLSKRLDRLLKKR
jgi:polyhydroxyalkanoate synthesis regulator phasin